MRHPARLLGIGCNLFSAIGLRLADLRHPTPCHDGNYQHDEDANTVHDVFLLLLDLFRTYMDVDHTDAPASGAREHHGSRSGAARTAQRWTAIGPC